MISMLCQKSNAGKITHANKDLYNVLVLDNKEITSQNVDASHFLKKFPKTKVKKQTKKNNRISSQSF